MWFLKLENADVHYYLISNNKDKYTIGRVNQDLILNDKSISREHGYIIVKQTRNGLKLELVDTGSKYGTYLNDGIKTKTLLKPNETIHLNNLDLVRFGQLGNRWSVHETKINTCMSTVRNVDKEHLVALLKNIDGTISDSWNDTCTHLTMPTITITIKVIQALLAAVPIVTLQFWQEFADSVLKNLAPPDPDLHIPKLAETLLNCDSTVFQGNPKRKSIFKDKTFIFLSNRQYTLYCDIVNVAGGNAVLLSKVRMSKSALCEPDKVVVLYESSRQSQESQMSQSVVDIGAYLQKKNRRMIPDQEIGLAIVYCSIEKYCNPSFKFADLLLIPSPVQPKRTVIAPESLDVSLTRPNVQTVSNVPSTLSDTFNIPSGESTKNINKNIIIPETIESDVPFKSPELSNKGDSRSGKSTISKSPQAGPLEINGNRISKGWRTTPKRVTNVCDGNESAMSDTSLAEVTNKNDPKRKCSEDLSSYFQPLKKKSMDKTDSLESPQGLKRINRKKSDDDDDFNFGIPCNGGREDAKRSSKKNNEEEDLFNFIPSGLGEQDCVTPGRKRKHNLDVADSPQIKKLCDNFKVPSPITSSKRTLPRQETLGKPFSKKPLLNSTRNPNSFDNSEPSLNISNIPNTDKKIICNKTNEIMMNWISHKTEKVLQIKHENTDIDDETKEWINSMKNKLTVKFVPIIVKKQNPIQQVTTNSAGVNFKTFKKVAPVHPRNHSNFIKLINYTVERHKSSDSGSLGADSDDEDNTNGINSRLHNSKAVHIM